MVSDRDEVEGKELNPDLQVQVVDDEIIVTASAFYAAYCKPVDPPPLILRRRTATDDHELLAQAWQAANSKARELDWIV
jgi:hypothetical protein